MLFKGVFSKKGLRAWERPPLPVKWNRCAVLQGALSVGVLEQGGGLRCFIPLPGFPPLSNHRYGVTHPGGCRGDTALGTERPGHPGRVSTVCFRGQVFAAP